MVALQILHNMRISTGLRNNVTPSVNSKGKNWWQYTNDNTEVIQINISLQTLMTVDGEE